MEGKCTRSKSAAWASGGLPFAALAILTACGGTPTLANTATHTSAQEHLGAHPMPTAPPENVTCPSLPNDAFDLPPLETEIFRAPLPSVEDDDETLKTFHESMLALARGLRKTPIRIGVYGDSNMTQDGISGGMRRTLQRRFGDAGHGYVALGRAWPWYLHLDVRHASEERAWTSYSSSTNPPRDRVLGFANMAFDSKAKGATTWVTTADQEAVVGASVGRFDLFYLEEPGRGSFKVRIDHDEQAIISTAGPERHARVQSFGAPDGAHRFEITTTTERPVRVFGVALEREVPGVVVDSLGTGALNYEQMTRIEDKTRREMLEKRHYDLVLFHLGANIFGPGEEKTNGWTKAIVDAHRAAVPGLPVMILSPSDIDKSPDDKKSDPRIVALVGQLRRAATLSKAAYWDFWSAMGGHMSMKALRKKGLASSDLIHFVRPSAILMGDRLAHALVESTKRYLDRHPNGGCKF